MNPLEPPITHISVKCLNIEPPNLITIKQWMTLILTIDIHS